MRELAAAGEVASRSLSEEDQRRLDMIERAKAKDEDVRRVMEAAHEKYVAEASWGAVAEQHGLDVNVLKQRASRLFSSFREQATRHPGRSGVVTLLIAFGVLLGVRDQQRLRMDTSRDLIPVAVGPDPMPPLRAPDDTSLRLAAAQLRDDGLKACAASAWSECATKLEAAAELDPTLERDPVVTKAKQKANDMQNAKRAPP
ncbi:MAG: hypothetical protein ACLQVI_41185 [Polyangiaceae bacterium]